MRRLACLVRSAFNVLILVAVAICGGIKILKSMSGRWFFASAEWLARADRA
jgi:hypothetical protein